MNWLLVGALLAGSAAFGCLLGWSLGRAAARVDAQADAIRANLTRPTLIPGNYGAWRYRDERTPSASRRILGPRDRTPYSSR
ncbi:MAG: hypothetical protein M3252_02945 [Actinomycetota bacterium]|nr:hypothetical protein [Actinomycetota bacterium]